MATLARSARRNAALLTAGAVGVSALIGAALAIHPKSVVLILLAVGIGGVGLKLLTRPVGVVVPLGVAFLLPSPPPFLGLPPSFIQAVVLFASGLLWWASVGRPKVNGWLVAAIVLTAVWDLKSVLSGSADLFTVAALVLLAAAGAVIGVTANHYRSSFADALAGVASFASIVALSEAVGVRNYWADITRASEHFSVISTVEDAQRSISTFGHPLIAGACLATSAVLLASIGRNKWHFAAAALATAGGIATVSRSASLGFLAGATVLVWIERRQLGRIGLALVVGLTSALLVLGFVPTVAESFSNRVVSSNYAQTVREYALNRVGDALSDPGGVLLGGGPGTVARELEGIGGINGYYIFDNQYATSLFEYGWIPLALVVFAICGAVLTAGRDARTRWLPAVVCLGVILAFVDGLSWSSLGLLSWIVVGAFTAPTSTTGAPLNGGLASQGRRSRTPSLHTRSTP